MKEIEILVEVYDDIRTVKEKFQKFNYKGLKKTVDEYYENIKENGGIYSTIGLSWEEKRKYYENVFKK